MTFGTTLALDGSTYAGSVAVIHEANVVAELDLGEHTVPGRGERDERFMPMVEDCLRNAKVELAQIDRIVCGSGPGSFTSLRIAGSIAKGLAVGLDRPLFTVSSLTLIVAGSECADGRWLAALPAMREEVFAALFEVKGGNVVETGQTRLFRASELNAEARQVDARLIGPLAAEPLNPHARGVSRILEAVIAGGPSNVESWEPVYGRLAEAQVKWEATHGRPLFAPE